MNHGSPGGNPRNLEGDGQCGGRLVGHGVWSEGAGFLAMEPGLEMERRNVEEYLRFGA